MNKATDLLNTITQRAIAEIESGSQNWFKSWIVSTEFVSRRSGNLYSFYNQALLRHQAAPSGEFAGFAAIKAAGGSVKKGAHGFDILYTNRVAKNVTDKDTGETETKFFNLFKLHTVFHVETQTDLKPLHVLGKPKKFDFKPEKIAEKIAGLYLQRERVALSFGGESAFYRPSNDSIRLPHKKAFVSETAFYSTAFHEIGHSTGAPNRLKRKEVENPLSIHFGSKAYAREELTAELTAASLINLCGIETKNSFKNSAAYLANWLLSALKNDKALLWQAASKADRAVKFILASDSYALPPIEPDDPDEFLIDDDSDTKPNA